MECRNRTAVAAGTGQPKNGDDDHIGRLPRNVFSSAASFVMVVNGKTPTETKQWLIGCLLQHSMQLSVVTDDDNHNANLTLLISCPDSVLNQHRSRIYQQLKRQPFDQVPDDNDHDNLNTAEQQRILYHVIREIRAVERQPLIGLPHATLYPGQSIVEICHQERVILEYFPLHDYRHLEKLRANFCRHFDTNLEYVRDYFGEMIGFYFAFLAHYKEMFLAASLFYLFACIFYLPNEIYTLLLCFGIFVFIKTWKRRSAQLALKWGTIELPELELARPAFRSKGWYQDPVTGLMAPFYPITKTWCKEYLISVPFVAICLCLSFELMCVYFASEDWMYARYETDPSWITFLLCLVPGIGYALIVMVLNHLYIIAATRLNNYENHKTQESHENHLIVKLVLFEFFNNFISLFYIAFYLKDMDMLRYNLITMLTINKMVENIIEVFFPMYWVYGLRFPVMTEPQQQQLNEKQHQQWPDIVRHQMNLYTYEHTYYDCLELFIQFGYAFLFVAIWPWAPVVAFANSALEVRLDALKLCYCNRRPFQQSRKSINNAWMKCFEVMSLVVVICNLLVLVHVSTGFKSVAVSYNLSTFELAVYVEHIFLAIILVFWYVVPDISRDVSSRLKWQRNLSLISNNKKSI